MKKPATLFFTITIMPGYTQLPRVNIPGSQVRERTSSNHNGQEYGLKTSLPAGYLNGTKKYPVVYLMGAHWDFRLVKSLYGQQYFGRFIPEIIMVGVKSTVI